MDRLELLMVVAALAVALMFVGSGAVRGQEDRGRQEFARAGCAACHGPTAKGGLASPLAGLTRSYPEFLKIVREGMGDMPAQSKTDVSDEQLAIIHEWLVQLPPKPTGGERASRANTRGRDPLRGKELR